MLDITIAYKRYKFLGNEFLTWFWFYISEQSNQIKNKDNDLFEFEINNQIILENILRDKSKEKIVIKGEEAGLEEAFLALQKGALVTEISLLCKKQENTWAFKLKGESFSFSSLKTPNIAFIDKEKETERFILEKLYFYETIIEIIDFLYLKFVKLRFSNEWKTNIVPKMKNWINS